MDVLDTMVRSMLDADGPPDTERLDFIVGYATRTKNSHLLAQIASLTDLPDHVEKIVADSAAAAVVAARLRRPGVTREEQVAAARDPRVTVGAALAATVGLPVEVYRTLVSNHKSPAVLLPIAENHLLPVDLRRDATVRAYFAACSSNKRDPYYRASLLVSTVPGAADELLDRYPDRVEASMFEAFAKNTWLRPDNARKLVTMAVEKLSSQSRRYSPYRTTDCLEILAGYTDFPTDLMPSIAAVVDSHTLASIHKAQASAVPRTGPDLSSTEQATTPEQIEAVIEQLRTQSSTSGAAALLTHPLLTDEQYCEVLLTFGVGWNEINVRSTLRNQTSPRRQAALLVAFPWYFDDDILTSLGRPEETLVYVLELANRYGRWQYSITQSRYFTEDMLPLIPASRILEAAGASAAVSRMLADYLWARCGGDAEAWRQILTLVPKFQGQLQEAVDVALFTIR